MLIDSAIRIIVNKYNILELKNEIIIENIYDAELAITLLESYDLFSKMFPLIVVIDIRLVVTM